MAAAAAAAKLFLTSSPGFGCAERGGEPTQSPSRVGEDPLSSVTPWAKNVMIIISVSPRRIFAAFTVGGSSASCSASALFKVFQPPCFDGAPLGVAAARSTTSLGSFFSAALVFQR